MHGSSMTQRMPGARKELCVQPAVLWNLWGHCEQPRTKGAGSLGTCRSTERLGEKGEGVRGGMQGARKSEHRSKGKAEWVQQRKQEADKDLPVFI